MGHFKKFEKVMYFKKKHVISLKQKRNRKWNFSIFWAFKKNTYAITWKIYLSRAFWGTSYYGRVTVLSWKACERDPHHKVRFGFFMRICENLIFGAFFYSRAKVSFLSGNHNVKTGFFIRISLRSNFFGAIAENG